MKKILFTVSVFTILVLNSCLKDKAPNVFTNSIIIEIPQSGIEYFEDAALDFPAGQDTLERTFTVNIASLYPLDKDLNITIGVDTNAIATYNVTSSPSLQYELLPANAYTLDKKTSIIKAGSRLDTFNIKFYKLKMPTNRVFMLPISIKDADGQTISGNFGTMYYHRIGNCLSGPYSSSIIQSFYDASDNFLYSFPFTIANKFMKPVTVDTARIDYGTSGGSGWQYFINIDCNTDSILSLSPNDIMYSNIRVNSFRDSVHEYNVADGIIHLITSYRRSDNSKEVIDETLTLMR